MRNLGSKNQHPRHPSQSSRKKYECIFCYWQNIFQDGDLHWLAVRHHPTDTKDVRWGYRNFQIFTTDVTEKSTEWKIFVVWPYDPMHHTFTVKKIMKMVVRSLVAVARFDWEVRFSSQFRIRPRFDGSGMWDGKPAMKMALPNISNELFHHSLRSQDDTWICVRESAASLFCWSEQYS